MLTESDVNDLAARAADHLKKLQGILKKTELPPALSARAWKVIGDAEARLAKLAADLDGHEAGR